ncbi:hypothetical protein [Ralstonia solanacearum]|uniref:hypothetical protein n=1 Tax=Ralstonia solanacearum TaxID=305 RepID=UPI0019D397AB|nr:hypothetical protein [Ralstonia solanacearum]
MTGFMAGLVGDLVSGDSFSTDLLLSPIKTHRLTNTLPDVATGAGLSADNHFEI